METNGKNNFFINFIKFTQGVFSVTTVMIFLFLIVGQIVMPDERDHIVAKSRIFEAEWQQILDDGTRVPVEVPGKVPVEYGEVATIVTTVPKDVTSEETICFRTIWQDVEIYVGDELRLSHNTADSRPFGTNSTMRYLFVDLEAGDTGKEIRLQFSSRSKYSGDVRQAYIGDRIGIWINFISESGPRTVISVSLMFLSMACIIICAVLRFVYKKKLALNYLAWTLLFGALWMLSEIEFRQLVFRNVSVLTSITYWCLMLIPISFIFYINEIQNWYYKKVFVGPLFYSVVLLVVGTTFQIFDIVQFVDILFFMHIGIGMAVIVIIGTIAIDTITRRSSDYLLAGIGVYGMLFATVLEVVLYYIDTDLTLGTSLAGGLLFLFVMAVIKTGQDLFQSEQKKQQVIVAREAQAKFLANMSHEIRTPINAIIGMNEMILRENEDATIQEYAYNVQSASDMLLRLVNDVLDFSKIESGQLELVEENYNLTSMIQEELLLLQARAAGKPISISVDIDKNLPSKLYGDELRIKQIVTNLLSNAVKYTKEGSVTFKTFFRQKDADNIILQFSVIDTGIGIKEEDLSKLFNSFKRLELNKNRNIQGTGLGLNIAKSLVELMGGDIQVDSEYEKGSTFTVSIPQKIVDAQPIGDFDESLRRSREEKKTSTEFLLAPYATVLVIDDNAMNLSLMKGLLKRTKIQVDIASGGIEGCEMSKNKHYDIIFMDHMMPEVDGVEALRMIRSDKTNPNRKGRIIALTANAVAGCREMYLKHGFDDYFAKPIQADKLDELLMKYLSGKEVNEEAKNSVNPSKAKDVSDDYVCDESEDLLSINRNVGLSYCMNSEEMYQEILEVFCEQTKESIDRLEKYYEQSDWKNYAIVVHSLKGNALNIGATNFSELSKKHEFAAKEGNEEFINDNFAVYMEALKKLLNKVKNL